MSFFKQPVSKEILNIAGPSIISNITVPLLGLVDVAIVGHLGSAAYIGAIAVGGMLFNMIYWLFGFLRMGTGGLTAQAYGKGDSSEIVTLLSRSLTIGLILSFILICLQYPVCYVAFNLIDATPEVSALAVRYFYICIWGAPATLGLYSFTGWFIGMQNTRFPMYIAIVQNLVNIAASLFFVLVLHMKVEGVALGTVIAQYMGLGMAVVLTVVKYKGYKIYFDLHAIFENKALIQFFKVNRDIFLRTLCVIAVTVFFTSAGAAHGDVILAVNTVLMQLFTLFSYIMDGFAYAGEALTGKNIGADNHKGLVNVIKYLFCWGTVSALFFTLLYAVAGNGFIALLTNDQEVLLASHNYFYWVLAIPLAGYAAFLLDGIFIGATATNLMLRSMFVAAVSFFVIYYSFHSFWGNHALWLAFISYLLVRGIMQAVLGRNIIRNGVV